ncbi:MAG: alpha/beta hydrolase [Bacteroidia bacterium]|nr:alpha/beta hydrolase [Bacteroidia bacterium]MDW8347866.1 alpha/beta hydrolase [Bacteroidia bacterium]
MITYKEYQDIRYFSLGNTGEPIILLHGFCEHAGIWADFAQKLAPHHYIVAMDLLGHTPYATVPDKTTFTIDDMADRVVLLLEHLNIPSATVIGHSMGGYVALNLLKRYPDYLSGLGLFHSTPYPDDEEKKNTRNRMITLLKEGRKAQFIELQMTKLTDEEGWKKIGQEKQDEVFEMMLSIHHNGMIAALQAMRDRKSSVDVLIGTPIPVVFILGKKDTLIPISSLQDVLTAPLYAYTHVIQDAAHLGMLENPDACYSAIKDFMKVKPLWIKQNHD